MFPTRRFFEREPFATARNAKAAAGADATQLSIALQLVLMVENVEYQMKEASAAAYRPRLP
jgi:hypothetical protein